MPKIIASPKVIESAGNAPKIINEFIGSANSDTKEVSLAKMDSPAGWSEPGQTPEFDEYTVVLNGTLFVQTRDNVFEVNANQAIITNKGEWVRYSTPGGAEYISVCLPAFTPESVHRDPE